MINQSLLNEKLWTSRNKLLKKCSAMSRLYYRKHQQEVDSRLN